MINDASRDDTWPGLLMALSDKIKKDMEGALPCRVTKVSPDRRRVSVKPLIAIIGKDGSVLQREIIEGLTVYQAGAGDIVMSFPVKVGDIGWIDASDRDISLFLQSYGETTPPTRRKHSFSDARFVPDIMTNFQIAGEDNDAVVIQTRDNSVKIALDENQIRIRNQSVDIRVDNSTVIGTAPDGWELNGARITPDGDVVTSSGVSLDKHPHSQGADSDGNTQVPTNPPTPTE